MGQTQKRGQEPFAVPSHFEQLRELEWLIGRWLDQDDKATVATECNGTKNNNFITRSFTIQVRDRIDMAGMQIIGADPFTRQHLHAAIRQPHGGRRELLPNIAEVVVVRE